VDNMGIFQSLTKSSEPVIAILATIVLILGGVIVYIYKHMQNNTVPKWAWEQLIDRMIKKLDEQERVNRRVKQLIQNMETILDERI